MLLDYRKDIDGLRALAVLLVVFFHAGFSVSGGFVGVDIFFVISGFLIASLIQKQILRGKFTFKGFYLHRMRRILPALLLVIITMSIAAWYILPPHITINTTRETFASLLSLSNIFYWKNSVGYFVEYANQFLLLHTWSLSTEEQFYIGVPIFLIILFKYFYQTKWFNYILSFVLVISFLISQYLAVENSTFAYYNLPARFFELFIGVWLALNYSKLPVSSNKWFNNLLAVAGLLLIIIPAFMLEKTSLFPGYNALFVCLGSAILIYLGKVEEKTLITKFLSLKPVVFIGLISYSLYLWHWPVLALIDMTGLELAQTTMLLVILSLIILSYFSWKCVEQPFRNKFKYGFLPTFVMLFVLPIVLAFSAKYFAHKYADEISKFRLQENMEVASSVRSNPFEIKKLCHGNIKDNLGYDKKYCTTINDEAKLVNTLIIGDSHVSSAMGFLQVLLDDANLNYYILTNPGTIYLTGLFYTVFPKKYAKDKAQLAGSKKSYQHINSEIESGKYKYILVGGLYSYYTDSMQITNLEKYFINTIEKIKSVGAIPIILEDVPMLRDKEGKSKKRSFNYCKYYNKVLNLNKQCTTDYLQSIKSLQAANKIFTNLKMKYPDLIFIDPKKIICKNNECKAFDGDISLYIDDHHLSYIGSKIIGQKYLEKYGNPFAKLKN